MPEVLPLDANPAERPEIQAAVLLLSFRQVMFANLHTKHRSSHGSQYATGGYIHRTLRLSAYENACTQQGTFI